jgi:hypothetical protein
VNRLNCISTISFFVAVGLLIIFLFFRDFWFFSHLKDGYIVGVISILMGSDIVLNYLRGVPIYIGSTPVVPVDEPLARKICLVFAGIVILAGLSFIFYP